LLHGQNRDMYDIFDNNAITNNAYTSNTDIVFHITGLDTLVNKYKYKFLENISKFDVSQKTFENEKNVVIQEYQDYFNQQQYSHHENLFRKYLTNYGPIGSLEDLKRITLDDCKTYYEKQFKQPTQIINVSKKYPFNKNITFAKKQIFPNVIIKKNDNVEIDYKNSYQKKSIISLGNKVVTTDFAIVSFINSILSSGLNSPLYKLIREKYGLVYNISMYLEPITNDSGVITINTMTDNIKNANKIKVILDYILSNPKKFITKERFNITKNLTSIELFKEQINRFASVDDYMFSDKWRINKIIKDLTLDDVYKVYDKYFHNWLFTIDTVEFKK